MTSFEAEIKNVTTEKTVTPANSNDKQVFQKIQVEALSGTESGQIFELENDGYYVTGTEEYKIGDQVVVSQSTSIDGTVNYYITDIVRRPSLILLFALFVGAALAVGRWRGLMSLLSLAVSFLVIFLFVLPQIAAGANPILIVCISCIVIIPAIFLLSHGWNKQTLIAMLATFICVVITGLLIVYFVNAAALTGLASEEAGFIAAQSPGLINLKNLLIAGMLIATLGVLDDVTISQAVVVAELKKANGQLTFRQLYTQASRVGRDHIASMTNTLILAYAGASFPLLLLFVSSQQSLALTLNFELIAEEIVRTLTGSIGLILAVPLTTALAALSEEVS